MTNGKEQRGFAGLASLASDLEPYQEIPVDDPMDQDLKDTTTSFKDTARRTAERTQVSLENESSGQAQEEIERTQVSLENESSGQAQEEIEKRPSCPRDIASAPTKPPRKGSLSHKRLWLMLNWLDPPEGLRVALWLAVITILLIVVWVTVIGVLLILLGSGPINALSRVVGCG